MWFLSKGRDVERPHGVRIYGHLPPYLSIIDNVPSFPSKNLMYWKILIPVLVLFDKWSVYQYSKGTELPKVLRFMNRQPNYGNQITTLNLYV